MRWLSEEGYALHQARINGNAAECPQREPGPASSFRASSAAAPPDDEIPLLVDAVAFEPGFPLLPLCREARLPVPATEFRFHPKRKWRFDYAWAPRFLALEVDGGVWSGGRHVTGSGRIADMEKMTEAAILGWRILYVTPQEVVNGRAVALIRRALDASR